MTPWRHYVYVHRRNDTNVVFYVGKGAHRKSRGGRTFERAHAATTRNALWRRVVAAAGGFTVEIVAECATDEDACAVEMSRIAGTTGLVNLTAGGDGRRNGVFSEQERLKRSLAARGPRSAKWVAAIRLSRKGGGNGGVVKRGDKLPGWWRARIGASVTGEKNHMYGRTGARHPNSRRVIDTVTGQSYASITEAAQVSGTPMKTLHGMLTGFRPNRTTMRLSDG